MLLGRHLSAFRTKALKPSSAAQNPGRCRLPGGRVDTPDLTADDGSTVLGSRLALIEALELAGIV